MIAEGLAAYDDAVRARWEGMRIEPEMWRCSPWGDSEGGFWVVAIEGGRALWFNNIEDGFNWSPFSRRGTLDDYLCNETEFVEILERFAQEISENTRVRVPEGQVPVDGVVRGRSSGARPRTGTFAPRLEPDNASTSATRLSSLSQARRTRASRSPIAIRSWCTTTRRCVRSTSPALRFVHTISPSGSMARSEVRRSPGEV